MKLVIISVLFALNVSAQNFNESLMKLSNQNQECLDKGGNMLGCSQKYNIQVDSLLNVVYKSIRKDLNETQQLDLKNKQLAWIKNRDLEFKKIDAQNTGLGKGSDDLMVKTQHKADFVSERVSFLIAAYISKKGIVNYKNQIFKFIPNGYQILDSVRGNLNNDTYDDYILVLKKYNEEQLSKTANVEAIKRPLLILVGNSENKLVLKGQNDNSVLCISCSGAIHGDSFEGVKIKNGYFSVEHYTVGGNDKWSKIITFKFDSLKNNWFLHRDGMEFFGWNPDQNGEAIIKTGETILTKKNFGEVLFENYDIYKNN